MPKHARRVPKLVRLKLLRAHHTSAQLSGGHLRCTCRLVPNHQCTAAHCSCALPLLPSLRTLTPPSLKKYPSKPANKASETYKQDQHCNPCWVCCQPTITSHTVMPHSLTLSSTPSCATKVLHAQGVAPHLDIRPCMTQPFCLGHPGPTNTPTCTRRTHCPNRMMNHYPPSTCQHQSCGCNRQLQPSTHNKIAWRRQVASARQACGRNQLRRACA